MDITALAEALDRIEDRAVVHHGCTDCMRDYEVVVHMTADPRTGVPPAHLRHLCTGRSRAHDGGGDLRTRTCGLGRALPGVSQASDGEHAGP
ncbi:YxiG-like protein [Streptomyces sp. NBC_00663]|uniref:YxiG-like protein n=1 Tax=Streptomyces sp. NBC_00663 TaxID=2975801 RepID=UPI003FCD3DED